MGMWDVKPWDNDSAADWFGDLMETCNIREEWLKGMAVDTEDEPEVVRAAIALFLMLGRVYIWPIAKYDEDLELAISRTKALLESDLCESEDMTEAIQLELTELEDRRKENTGAEAPVSVDQRPWWKFW